MKKTLLTLAIGVLAIATSYGQGTIIFPNTIGSRVQWETAAGSRTYVNVPIGAPIVYGVFWGTTADSLQLNGGPLGTASTAGIGIINAPSVYALTGTTPGDTYFMKVGGWSSQFQRDFATAKTTPGVGGVNNYYGETGIRSFKTGPDTGPGTVIWSTLDPLLFSPLKLDIVVPEPSVIALGVLGVGALLLRRRKTA
jgi:hypothetical protein